jgi:hypothetical protein
MHAFPRYIAGCAEAIARGGLTEGLIAGIDQVAHRTCRRLGTAYFKARWNAITRPSVSLKLELRRGPPSLFAPHRMPSLLGSDDLSQGAAVRRRQQRAETRNPEITSAIRTQITCGEGNDPGIGSVTRERLGIELSAPSVSAAP